MCAIARSAPRVLLLAFAATLALAASIQDSLAQAWPQRTVKLIIPLPPGTGTDVAGRLLAERLAERWGQPVVVENKQGGDGIPAVTAFLSARDTHTLLERGGFKLSRQSRPLKIQENTAGSGNKCLRAIGATTRSLRNWVRSAKKSRLNLPLLKGARGRGSPLILKDSR